MKNTEFNTINVIPLVDVMLVLLTIVLTTSTFIAMGAIPVQIPRATQSGEGAVKGLTIEIDEGGAIYVNARPLGMVQELKSTLTGVERTTPLLIRADRGVALQVFVDVLDTVKQLGFGQISLQTEKRL